MIKKVVVCDMCGREYEGNPAKIGMWRWDLKEDCYLDSKYKDYLDSVDFCKECMEKIVRFLKGTPEDKKEMAAAQEKDTGNPVNADMPGQTPQHAKKKKKPIDKGKVMALKDAGWSNEKIADEVGATKTNVAYIVCKEKKKRKQQEGAMNDRSGIKRNNIGDSKQHLADSNAAEGY